MRKIKCIISIMLVLFICFQSFAAVVSEMDGSAFITKEEFENMKNEFAYQIEQYNKSIDDKIDGAISQYLKGIRLASKTSYNLIMKSTSLKNVNFMNGTIATTYKIPNSKFVYDITFSNTKEYGAGSGYRCHGGIHVTRILKYDNGLKNTNNTNNKYLLALKDKESEGSASSYVWDGIAIQYIEWVNSTLSCFGAFGWLDWIDANEPYRHTIQLRYPTCLIGTGYNANIRDQILNNNLKVYYTNNRSGASSLFENWANRVASNSMYVELGKVNNLDRTHKCLISYTNDIKYKGHLETATNTLTEDSANPLTDASILNSSETLLNTGIHVAYNANNSNMYNNGQYAATTPQSTTQTGNYRISTVGYLGEYQAKDILLYDGTISKMFSTKWELSGTKLSDGFPLLAAKRGEKVEWDAKFDNVVCFNAAPNGTTTSNSSGTNFETNKNEVDIYLSYEPFGTKLTQTDNDNFIKWTVDGREQNYITTTGREKKISFTMKKDSIVYMKAVPHFEVGSYNGLDNFWDLELNIDGNCGTWTIESD